MRVFDLLQPESTGLESISANAQTITDRVCVFLTNAKFEISKLGDIGTDGASTIIVCRNGVVTCLKSLAPSAISVHCAAHRLNLTSSHASVSLSYVGKFHAILRQLLDFFNNSAVKTAGLEAV